MICPAPGQNVKAINFANTQLMWYSNEKCVPISGLDGGNICITPLSIFFKNHGERFCEDVSTLSIVTASICSGDC